MAASPEVCVEAEFLARFLDEQLSEHEEARVTEHLGHCESCRDRMEALASGRLQLDDIKQNLFDHPMEQTSFALTEVSEEESEAEALADIISLLAPTDDPTKMGRLGNYEICGVIGRGSAGIVFKAHDQRLNRFVAIKMLAPGYTANGSSRARFEREGRAIAAVRDDHVIPIYGVDEFRGNPFIVMQYAPAGSLQQRLDREGPLETKEVVRIGMQVASALAAAHRQGIIHRDVKPGNVLLEDGVERAVVTDFGLARVADEATMTHSGAISGTPQYMSPEQAKGESLDQRSDLFSLGSVMYAACVGHAPFRSESLFGVIKKVCENKPADITEENPDIAPWLVAFIRKLQAKRKEDRFDSAKEVADLLAAELAHLQSPTMSAEPARDWWNRPGKRIRENAKRVATVGALACVGVFAIVALNPADSEQEAARPDAGLQVASSSIGAGQPGQRSYRFLAADENESILEGAPGSTELAHRLSETVPVKPGGTIQLSTNYGAINVTTHDQDECRLLLVYRVKSDHPKEIVDLLDHVRFALNDEEQLTKTGLKKGRDVVVAATLPEIEQIFPKAGFISQDVIFDLQVPKKFNLSIVTDNGTIRTADIKGDVNFRCQNGVELGDLDGNAKVIAISGPILAGNVTGDADFESLHDVVRVGNIGKSFFATAEKGHVSALSVGDQVVATTLDGNITIAHAKGPLVAKSETGSIIVSRADDAVEANSLSGPISVNFADQPTSGSALRSQQGTLQVRLARNISAAIEARTPNGTLLSPLFEEGRTEYKMNGGDQLLLVESLEGQVNIRYLDQQEVNSSGEARNRLNRAAAKAMFEHAYQLHLAREFDLAILAYKEAIKSGFQPGVSYYNLGCAYAQNGNVKKAYNSLREAIELGYGSASQLKNDSDLKSLQGGEEMERLLALFGEHRDLRNLSERAASLFHSEKYKEAEEICRQILASNPDDEFAVMQLGASLHFQRRLDEARPLHERTARSRRFAGIGKFNLACVDALNGEKEAALEKLVEAVASGFDDVEQYMTDEDLDSLRDDERFDRLLRELKACGDEAQEDECEQETCDESDCGQTSCDATHGVLELSLKIHGKLKRRSTVQNMEITG